MHIRIYIIEYLKLRYSRINKQIIIKNIKKEINVLKRI